MGFHRVIFLGLLLFFFSGCDPIREADYTPEFADKLAQNQEVEYIFGIHPLHNPHRLNEVFSPLMDYLSKHITGIYFTLEASRNYAAFDQKLYAKRFHFALPNPFQTINAADKGYLIFAKMGDDSNFRGIILVRKDSGIKQISDLKGQAVSYPAPTALAATMMPQYYIQTHGVNVLKDLDNRYVGSQESSIMSVFLKQTIAAATWPPPWQALKAERPELERELEVKWQTDPLPNNGVVAHPEVDKTIISQVQELLVNLHKTPEGEAILKKITLSKFEKADHKTYKPVRDFVKNFSKKVRPLD